MALPSLLWHSNAPHVGTGYGGQTSLFCKPLAEHYRMGISAFYGIEGNVAPWNGIPVFPAMAQTMGNELIRDHAGMFFPGGDLRGGLTVTLMDVWVLDPKVWRELNVACWVPVDHDPVPPPVAAFFKQSGAMPIAMSAFGVDALSAQGLEPFYVPHAVDTTIFKPGDKREAREELGLPQDVFIVGMFAANKGNPSRKCFAESFEAFRCFNDKHPESRLYCHSEASGIVDGVYLPDLARHVGLDTDLLIFPDQWRVLHMPWSMEAMATRYAAIDVFLGASAGEGFGIPTVEAQACGRPVIVSDFAASRELCGSGWLIEGRRRYTPMKSFQFQPYVEDIASALESAFRKSKAELDYMGEQAVEFAARYDLAHVLSNDMLPTLDYVRERITERDPVEIKAAA